MAKFHSVKKILNSIKISRGTSMINKNNLICLKRCIDLGLFGVLFFLISLGCSNRPNSDLATQKISVNAIVSSDASSEAKSVDLSDGAEKMLQAKGISEASNMAKMAVDLDPTNLKARFIKAVTSLLLAEKGMMARIQPIMEASFKFKPQYQKERASVEEKSSDYNQWLLNGQGDIHTERQLQIFIDTVINALDELRLVAKESGGQTLKLKSNSFLASDLSDRYARGCDLKVNATGEYEITCPPDSTRRDILLNQVDFESIRISASYYMVALMFTNAYDLTGLIESQNQFKDDLDSKEKVQEILEAYFGHEEFGKLRKESRLRDVKELGQDLVIAVRWAIANGNQFCPTGLSDSPKNRPGMLFNRGFCYLSYYGPYADSLEKFFSGSPTERSISTSQKVYKTKINWMALFDHPLIDLRGLGPLKVDRCGNIASVGDIYLGGAFPEGDSLIYLPLESDCNRL